MKALTSELAISAILASFLAPFLAIAYNSMMLICILNHEDASLAFFSYHRPLAAIGAFITRSVMLTLTPYCLICKVDI